MKCITVASLLNANVMIAVIAMNAIIAIIPTDTMMMTA